MSLPSRDLRNDRRRFLGAAGSVRVTLIFGSESLSARTVDLSPGGVGVVTREIKPSKLPLIHQQVELVYQRNTEKEWSVPARVRNVNFVQVGDVVQVRIGLSLEPALGEKSHKETESQPFALSKFVDCQEFFYAPAFCEDPIFFQEKLHFQAIAFSNRSLKLLCSARNKSLLPGVSLTLTLFLPMIGEQKVKVRTGVSRNSEKADRYVMEAEFLEVQESFLENLARFLIATGSVAQVEALVQRGFPVRGVEGFLRFETMAPEENPAILKSFKLERTGNTTEKWVLCKLGLEVLGSGRFAIIKGPKNPEDSWLSTQVARLPKDLIEMGFVEGSWVCAPGTPHMTDAYFHFVKNFARLTLEAGMRQLVTLCQKDAWPLCRALGFVPVDAQIKPTYGTDAQWMIVALDVGAVIRGAVPVHRSVWEKIYEPVASHLGLVNRKSPYLLSKSTLKGQKAG
jgi:hypothetical protein